MGGYIGSKVGTLVTTAANVSGNAIIDGDLTVKGTTITVDSATAQTVDLGDNDKIRLGDGDDLQIYHDGSRSIIQDSGTGNLRIQANNLELNNADNSENYLFAAANGAVELYYDNAKKIETTSSGVDISGGLVCSPNTAGKDTFQLSTNSVDEGRLRIKNVDTTTVQIRAGGESYFNGGNVGIGTSNPIADLSIVDATSGTGMEFQPEVVTGTNRLTNYDRVENAYKKFRLDASETAFFNSGTRIATINGSGFGIGTSGPSYKLTVSSGGMASAAEFSRNTDGTLRSLLRFRSSTQGADVGFININNSSTNYATSSDYRLKENVETLSGAITRVKTLKPKRFSWIVDEEDSANVDGFLAHEAQTVVPEAVTGTHNEVDDDGNPVHQGIDQSKLVPLLTAALQEAIAKIETLETKVAALEGA